MEPFTSELSAPAIVSNTIHREFLFFLIEGPSFFFELAAQQEEHFRRFFREREPEERCRSFAGLGGRKGE